MDKESSKAWDDAKKSALVAQIVSGKLSVKSACERHDLSPETIQDWVRVFRRTTLQAFDEHLRQTFLIQGADAAALGTAEYTGTLDDIPIADLIQTFQMGGKGGVITITRDGSHSHIWCDKGEIIDAECGTLKGVPAIYRILNFERGQVLADFHSEPRQRTIELPGNMLLLEAARRKDESTRLLDRLGDRAVYRSSNPSAVAANDVEREVLALCDGERSLKDVLERSELGDLETLSAVSSLVERNQLVQYGVSIAPPVPSTAITTVSKETPHNGVSFLPLVASQRMERPRRSRSPVAFLAVGLAVGTAIWIGASLLPRSAPLAARLEPPAKAPSPPVPEPGGHPPELFQLDSVVEPRHAEFWLDGVRLGVGRLKQELPRDGKPHSLRIAAEGYAPTTLLFVDAPPPRHIALEPLGSATAHTTARASDGIEPSSDEAAQELGASDDGSSAVGAASGSAARGAAARRPPPAARAKRSAAPSPARAAAERPAVEVESEAVESDAPARASAPRIQIIEADTPVVQVIE
ncbi:MAG TPA: DUF4388 domain-containing protein [Polyangiaceae bacterium]|nr:DUF4388 domain-containing protein [Polyangiaceae bacterium]